MPGHVDRVFVQAGQRRHARCAGICPHQHWPGGFPNRAELLRGVEWDASTVRSVAPLFAEARLSELRSADGQDIEESSVRELPAPLEELAHSLETVGEIGTDVRSRQRRQLVVNAMLEAGCKLVVLDCL